MEEMIETVRAALSPGADAATRQRAAAILRGLLTMLEPGWPASVASPGAPHETAVTPPDTPPRTIDVLGAILESVRPFLPAHVVSDLPRFRIPMVSAKG